MSITDVCNFRCTYCLPQGYRKNPGDMRSFLSAEEISRLVKALSELGVGRIRLTGGEPTVRKDFFDILKDMKQNFCKIYYLNPASARSDCISHVFCQELF